jgi:6-phosphogluconolactonase
MSVHWYAYPTPQEAAEACARQIVVLLEEALSGRPRATLAISGGVTPRLLFESLAVCGLPWGKIHLFWVDERPVPPADPMSNYGLAEAALIRPAGISRHNVHRIAGEFRPESAARRYSEEIRDFFELGEGDLPQFDVVQQGIGPDGHTASLFPDEPLPEESGGIAAAVHIRSLGQWRITLTPPVLMAARHTVFLVTGQEKAEAVRAVFHEESDPVRRPAQMISHHGRSVIWFLDQAAAALLD